MMIDARDVLTMLTKELVYVHKKLGEVKDNDTDEIKKALIQYEGIINTLERLGNQLKQLVEKEEKNEVNRSI